MTPRARKPAAPKRDRAGYYTHPATGERFMSVTTVLSRGIPKPALVHWASFEAAQCAVDNIPALVRARGESARIELRQWIQHAAERKRDTAADLGSLIHGIVEARVLGQPTPELTDEQRPFVEAFDRFLDDWQPEFEASELVVANPGDGWAGTLDAIARIPSLAPDLVVLDWKTGKGTYGEAAIQLATYRRATIGWTKDGTEVPMPQTVAGYVVHLRPAHLPGGEPDGYALIPARTDDVMYQLFRSAQIIAAGVAKDGVVDTALADPVPVPVPTKTEVA